ncbi:EpsG family protein [Alteromonas sp. ASW11-36]|uniref:EpsG family protein n=1 Tax=Alteromonas arenosi TaxID=3055817 RepID=A0ABT7SZ12_9ALTE|nr:EpsG family protein [Alteromonas sp. ASW11-36]MDM7861406.1 EpsG family protein [Alteromonas sp. ASW11-36]
MLFHLAYLTFFTIVAATFFDEKIVTRAQQHRFFQALLFCLVLQVAIMYIGRDIHGDTFRYLRSYDRMIGQDFAIAVIESGKELGFTLLSWLSANAGIGHRGYLTWIFVLGMVPFIAGLKRLYGNGWGYMFVAYITFPFFLSYFASGMRQAVAMSMAFYAIINYGYTRYLFRTLFVIGFAALFHMSVLVLLPALFALHFAERILTIPKILMIWVVVVFISAAGINESALGFLSGFFDDSSRYQYYLDTDKVAEVRELMNYQTGFRLDFTVFSIVPVLFVLYFERRTGIDLWLVKFYLIVNCAFQLLSFTASNDRFAALSWFYIPAILVHSQFYKYPMRSSKLGYYLLAFSGVALLALFNSRYFAG